MIKVHAIGEQSHGVLHDVAYIRLLNPLYMLAQQGKIIFTNSGTYFGYEECDIFFVQRTWSDNISQSELMQFIKFIKKNKKKLVYDIDDNLLDLSDIDNYKKNIVRILARNADCMIVTTENLKLRMSKFCNNIVILPNYLSLKNIEKRRNQNYHFNDKIKIGYMGTFSHQEDFQMIKLPLMKLLNKYKDKVEFEILGVLENISTLHNMPNVTVLSLEGRSRYDKFWEYMCEHVYWDIGLAPLKFNKFTACKSDIKFFDYASMKIAGVFSRHPAYEKTVINGVNGMLCDNTPEDWFFTLEKLVQEKMLVKNLAQKAHKKLYDERILEDNCDLWMEVILSLTKNIL